jgi:dUTP pyrophosphatase
LPLRFKKLHPAAILPSKTHDDDLGWDLFAVQDVRLEASSVTGIRTGIGVQFPPGYGGLIRGRSGLAMEKWIDPVAGVIDGGYHGEIVVLMNHIRESFGCHPNSVYLQAGQKIAQMVIVPIVPCVAVEVGGDEPWPPNRGDAGGEGGSGGVRGSKGFGSSGK